MSVELPVLPMLPLLDEPVVERLRVDLEVVVPVVLDPFDIVSIELPVPLFIDPGVPPMPVVPLDIVPLLPGDVPPPGDVWAEAAVAKAAAAARMIIVFIVFTPGKPLTAARGWWSGSCW